MQWLTPRQPADSRLSALLAGAFSRVTAPFRQARQALPDRPESEVPAIDSPAAGPFGKELARQVFHRGMRQLLQIPGGRQGTRLVRFVAPGPVEWLALRYRAYELRAVEPLPPDEPVIGPVVSPLDLSDEEARLYRRFVARGVADNPLPQGSLDPCRAGTAS